MAPRPRAAHPRKAAASSSSSSSMSSSAAQPSEGRVCTVSGPAPRAPLCSAPRSSLDCPSGPRGPLPPRCRERVLRHGNRARQIPALP
ncbi:hypothetical protein E2C01_066163 [Portunus trituberculatus]|uniref:Uncharacterized protein n=1 Tax=Portunus trituberculatus TaxID=210409 RepID=A0A5B7HP14_PORTR|nr:hypothetical protein [Portunus trituberculatus]